jgi:EAL domain-containing protein (putative c-di-GMP-specific phosphodiesterase class I)
MIKHSIENLKEDLRGEIHLNLDKYLTEESPGRFTAGFLGLKLDTVFQPIVDSATNRAIGFEALLRASVGGLATISPQMAFQYADSYGKLVKFDRICRTLHLLNSLTLPKASGLLFVNVHPKLLASVDSHGRVFEQILQLYSVPTHKVVIEIQESVLGNEATLRKALDNYRDCGYQVAIDDFGRRGSDLGRIWRLSPDFIKSDVGFIREVGSNDRLRRIFRKLVEIIRETGAEAVINGIENARQRELVLDSEVRYLQGHCLGMPAPASRRGDPLALEAKSDSETSTESSLEE